MTAKILQGEAFAISSLDSLPEEAAIDVEGLRRLKIKSSIGIPLSSEGSFDYVLAVGTVRQERTWPKELIPRLRLVGEILVNAVERKRAEETMRASEERFRTTFEQAAVGIAHVRRDGRFLRINRKFCDITGYSREEMLALTFQDITHPDDLQTDLEYVRQVLAGQIETYSMEKRYIRKDGGIVWVSLTVSLSREVAGEPAYFIGVVEDITHRKLAEAEISKLRAEHTHMSRVSAMGELTASLAHELKQPLAAIRSNAQAAQRFLASETCDLDEVRNILTDIVADDRRASEVIDRLRALMSKSDVRMQRLNINTVIRDVYPLVHSDSIARDILLRFELDDTIAPVVGDRIQLQQVVLNLILNGSEAMENTDVDVHELVVRTAQDNPGAVTVSVADRGRGIGEQTINRLFEPFYTTKPEGMGMGLPISRSIIEAHGGRLWAVNNPEQGATFHFTLPVFQENST